MRSATSLDYLVIGIYMLLMLGIGGFGMRLTRGASDYFKGSNRIPWIVAGLSSFMSGFSAWTFTGAAGVAYDQGLVAILLYVGNALTFLLGYWVFAERWRRLRITTTMEYLNDRFDESTRQIFSLTTVFFQTFIGASMLYALGLFVSTACHLPLEQTILVSGAVIVAYCVVGGLWAVVITDFLQAMILMPFTLVMLVAAFAAVGGPGALIDRLPPHLTDWRLPNAFGWTYVAAWTLMVSFGYNTAAMAQRYFSVDDERSAKNVALLCAALFAVGSLVWFVPPLAMRVLHPDLSVLWPGLHHPQETAYAVAALTLLPNGLVGIMLAAMFSATMSSLSGMLNMQAGILAKDIYQTWCAPRAGERNLLMIGWVATLVIGALVTLLAMLMAHSGGSVFQFMLTFNTIISLAYGPPALLGMLIRRTPSWSGLLSFFVALVIGTIGTFVLHWGLIANVAAVIPASVVAFVVTGLVEERRTDRVGRRDALFARLSTSVDVARELADVPDVTREVFRFLAVATAAIGAGSLLLLLATPAGERQSVIAYGLVTLACAALLGLVRGGRPQPAKPAASPGGPDSRSSPLGDDIARS
jgi:SSS family transporter